MNMYKRVKKDSKWTIQHLGNFDISGIKKEVSSFDKEWLIDTSRQNIGMTHKHTYMYRLCATDYLWIPGTKLEIIQYNKLHTEEANKNLTDIYSSLEKYYSGKIIRCEIIKLLKKSEIYKHTDGGALLHYSRRVHIPLITSKEITFTVMNNEIHMQEGGWYEINNQLPHSVSNKSDVDRIHMIVDIFPDDMMKYKIEKENSYGKY